MRLGRGWRYRRVSSFGSTAESKSKGVKVYSEIIKPVLSRYNQLTGEFRVVVSKPSEATDKLEILREGVPDDIDVKQL